MQTVIAIYLDQLGLEFDRKRLEVDSLNLREKRFGRCYELTNVSYGPMSTIAIYSERKELP